MCSGKLQTALLVASYFVYLLVGAAVFQALERTAEKQEKIAAAQMKEAFLQNFTHLTVAEMEQFMKVSARPAEALSASFLSMRCSFPLSTAAQLLLLCSCCCGHWVIVANPEPLSVLSRQVMLV